MQRPSVAELTSEDNHFALLARKFWLKEKKTAVKAIASTVKEDLYDKLAADGFPAQQLILLEQLQCLERFLWPGYSKEASDQHVILIALLVNVKRRAKLPAWVVFTRSPERFPDFFQSVLRLSIDSALDNKLRRQLLCFITNAFQSLDTAIVRKECAPLVSISIWHNLHSDAAQQLHIGKSAATQKSWRVALRRYDNAEDSDKAKLRFERSWLYTLLVDLLARLYDSKGSADQRQEHVLFSERVLELLCDLLSQLPTRRHVNTLVHDLNLRIAIQLSPLYSDEDAKLLREMHSLLCHYMDFPVDDQTGAQLSVKVHEDRHNDRILALQKAALTLFPDKLKILYLSNLASISKHGELKKHLEELNSEEIQKLCSHISLRTTYPGDPVSVDRQFLVEVLHNLVAQQSFVTDYVQGMTVLPTEKDLFAFDIQCTEDFDDSRPLPLPKLNLQYLTSVDFLWRSSTLYRTEAFYVIKKHIQDTMKRLEPRRLNSGKIVFNGFSKLAIPISRPAIIDTLPPRVGQDIPAEVKAEIVLDVSGLQPSLRREWDTLRPGDVVFLAAVAPTQKTLTNGADLLVSASERAGLKALRCAEVINVLDENSRVLRKDQEKQDHVDGLARPRQRRLLVRLDARAYKADQDRAGKTDVYEDINLVIRRKARENNFKAVLESVQNLTISGADVPSWLRDVFLGFGDPSSASYKRMSNKLRQIDLRDTFTNWHHLVQSFPGDIIEPDPDADASFGPPYVFDFPDNDSEPAPAPRAAKKRKREADSDITSVVAPTSKSIRVSTYEQVNTGPYPGDAPRTNSIPFTPTQVQAVLSGTQPGLTLIVGPPGTGKTDVATQIINNIYHDFPKERTLLVAHSNQALNQLFAKIAALDIDERHLLRLGHGEDELRTEASFSRYGRIDSLLERAGHRLAEVQKLAGSIGAPGAHGSTCETAAYFHQVYISPRWKKYWADVDSAADPDHISLSFPFHNFFADAPHPLFPADADRERLLEIARGCERHVNRIFEELADIRPFEILRSPRDKSNYLLLKEARIIAMTSTHAAMRRQEIATLGFQYDNIVFEEAAQITEIENFLPFAMQKPGKNGHELRRIVLVGDHLQNSPVIQNNALQASTNLEQSLFLRLVRLGVPHIMLDAQGRARPSLAELYHWRYPQLTNLPITTTAPEFLSANAGFRHEYQFIDVQAYKGKGESEPTPHFIQNLGEAEYAVALYQYMRLLGYPAERISILTAYAGQRTLIRDVLTHRCKTNRLFGMPGWVGTIDKYQGEQNDYVILSLVRTKGPGYLRDLRRLTVALSRARLGLYVLGRREVFESSLELQEAFSLLLQRSGTLEVVTGETWPASRQVSDVVEHVQIEGVEHMGKYIFDMTQAKVAAIKAGEDTLPAAAATIGRVEEEEEDGEADIEVPEVEMDATVD